MFEKIRKWKWVLAAAFCVMLWAFLPRPFIEQYYSRGFFLLVRKLMDNTFGYLPFPAYYLFLGFLVMMVVNWILHFFREKPQPFKERIFTIFSFACAMLSFFFVLWGFNYSRVSVEDQLYLHTKPMSQEVLLEEIKSTSGQLYNIRTQIMDSAHSMPQIVFINNIEDNARAAIQETLKEFNFPYDARVRGRFVFEDMFLYWNVGGQYMPFVGEANVDDGVFPSKKPFYLAHEMAHSFGFTAESDCNFLAYVSCVESGKLPFQYSGELNYLLYLLAELKSRDAVLYDSITTDLPDIIRADLEEIRLHQEKHTYKTGVVGNVVNELYLSALGVEDGIKNYDKMILLVYEWKARKTVN